MSILAVSALISGRGAQESRNDEVPVRVGSHAIKGNFTDPERTDFADLVVEGWVVGYEYGLMADDPALRTLDELTEDFHVAIENHQHQTRVTFAIDKWLKGNSASQIFAVFYHDTRGESDITQDFIDAAKQGRRFRVWLHSLDPAYSGGKHWKVWSADVI